MRSIFLSGFVGEDRKLASLAVETRVEIITLYVKSTVLASQRYQMPIENQLGGTLCVETAHKFGCRLDVSFIEIVFVSGETRWNNN